MEQLEIKRRLEQAGTEYDKGLERFMGNVALYHKFLLKFLADHSYEEFLQALDDGNLPVAEKSVHTLKGTAGNLSLMALFHAADDTVQAIRAGKQGRNCSLLHRRSGKTMIRPAKQFATHYPNES